MTPRSLRGLALIAALGLLVGCGSESPGAGDEASTSGKLLVVASFSPLADFARQIGGELVEVSVPLPSDADAATWRPDADALRTMQKAQLIFINGAGFESWTQTSSLPPSRVIATADGFRDRWIEGKSYTHSHGTEGEHSHTVSDGHTWLDPLQAIEQAAAIRDALTAKLPDSKAELEANFAGLKKELEALHAGFAALPLADRALIMSHAAWLYPARRYGWSVGKAHLDPSTKLTFHEVEHLDQAIEKLKAQGKTPGLVLWESEPIPEKAAETREFTTWPNVVWQPGENLSAGTSYLDSQRAALATLQAALRAPSATDG